MTHTHWFSAIPCHFGQYGPQDVHIHHCIEGEPGDCDRVVIGEGRECKREAKHERFTLTEDGPKRRATTPTEAE